MKLFWVLVQILIYFYLNVFRRGYYACRGFKRQLQNKRFYHLIFTLFTTMRFRRVLFCFKTNRVPLQHQAGKSIEISKAAMV
jgi:hypothetical protein